MLAALHRPTRPCVHQRRACALSIEISTAVSPAELRAAASLRALAFFTYPAGRSAYTLQVCSCRTCGLLAQLCVS